MSSQMHFLLNAFVSMTMTECRCYKISQLLRFVARLIFLQTILFFEKNRIVLIVLRKILKLIAISIFIPL